MNSSYTEILIFFYVIKNYDLAIKYKVDWWQNERLKRLFSIVIEFIKVYREEPTEQQVITLIKKAGMETDFTQDVIHSLWENKSQLSQYSEEWLHDCTEAYAEYNSLLSGINRMYTKLMTMQKEVTVENAHEVVQMIKSDFSKDTNFDLNTTRGFSFLDPAVHVISRPDTHTTGYPFFDKCLGGGWAKKTLVVIAGGAKMGKSIVLGNLCRNSILNGHNCAYITLEMSVGEVCSRMGAAMFNIKYSAYEEVAKDQQYIANCITSVRNQNLHELGECIIEQFPTSNLSPFELEAFLLAIENENSAKLGRQWKFEEIYVDYINIMKTARMGISASDSYTRVKTIAEDLRAVAIRNNWTIVSLTQLTRNYSMGCADIDITAISESHGLVQTVDCLLGLIQTIQMKLSGLYYIKALACRNSPHGGDKKSFKFEGDYMRITEDPDEDIIPEGIPLPPALTAGAPSGGNQGDPNGGWGPRKGSGGGSRQNNTQGQQSTQTGPAIAPPPPPAPDLGVTDLKVTGNGLFDLY